MVAFLSTIQLVKFERDRISVSALGRRRQSCQEWWPSEPGPLEEVGMWHMSRVLDWLKRHQPDWTEGSGGFSGYQVKWEGYRI